MIPVYEPLFGKKEVKYLRQAVEDSEVSGSGKFVNRLEEAFADWSGNKYAILVSSGTAALETAIWSMDIRDISVPSGTIISCYTAASRANANVYLRDNGDYYDSMPVMRCHLFGKWDACHTNTSTFIDDLSQYWLPTKVPSIGCYSLYANKLITSGEGGIVVTNNKVLYKRAMSYRNLCHSKERFIHDKIGYVFRMSNLQAALGLAQLEQIDKFTAIKKKNRDLYIKHLPSSCEILFDVDVPWMYLIKTKSKAGKVVKELKSKGVDTRRFFYPLHRQDCLINKFRNFYSVADFNVANDLWEHALYLPSGLTLTEKDIIHVSRSLRQIL